MGTYSATMGSPESTDGSPGTTGGSPGTTGGSPGTTGVGSTGLGAGGGEGTVFSANGPSGDDQRMRDANMKLPFKCLLMSPNVLHIMSKW